MVIKCNWFLDLLGKINGLYVTGCLVFVFIIVRTDSSPYAINHEKIHFYQSLETLFIGFYLIYFFNYVYLVLKYKSHYLAYMGIKFEEEAYANMYELEYLKNRKFYAWCRS